MNNIKVKRKVESNNKTFCCVYGCYSKANRQREVSFHYFPKKGTRTVSRTNKLGNTEKIDLYNVWMKKLKMGKTPSPYMKVCSLHFQDLDFISSKTGK